MNFILLSPHEFLSLDKEVQLAYLKGKEAAAAEADLARINAIAGLDKEQLKAYMLPIQSKNNSGNFNMSCKFLVFYSYIYYILIM